MVRAALSFLIGLVLAFAGVAFFVWVLWWLWTRLNEEQKVAPIEIEVQPPEPAGETLVGEAPVVEVEPEPVVPDDLKRIEGIGPKISSVLQEAGIMTFAQLAAATPEQLAGILESADPRLLRLADPATWPEQAALAASGEWEALEALHDTLKGGRRK